MLQQHKSTSYQQCPRYPIWLDRRRVWVFTASSSTSKNQNPKRRKEYHVWLRWPEKGSLQSRWKLIWTNLAAKSSDFFVVVSPNSSPWYITVGSPFALRLVFTTDHNCLGLYRKLRCILLIKREYECWLYQVVSLVAPASREVELHLENYKGVITVPA